MANASSPSLSALRAAARAAAAQARVPYSRRPAAAALLLSDGTWLPGVRVESASFSLTIPPLAAGLATATTAGQRDVVAAALSRPARPEEKVFLSEALDAPFEPAGEDALVRRDADLPPLGRRLDPFLSEDALATPEEGLALARAVAERAYVPASHFPVGCVLQTGSGRLVPGANVEHPDWTRTLCAERAALATAQAYGALAAETAADKASTVETVFLTCPNDPSGSPCGACRQLLVELAPAAMLWMDRLGAPPEGLPLSNLLPGSFHGQALLSNL